MGFVGGGGALRRGQHFSIKSIIYRRRNTPYGVFGKRHNRFQHIFGRVCDAVENGVHCQIHGISASRTLHGTPNSILG